MQGGAKQPIEQKIALETWVGINFVIADKKRHVHVEADRGVGRRARSATRGAVGTLAGDVAGLAELTITGTTLVAVDSPAKRLRSARAAGAVVEDSLVAVPCTTRSRDTGS